jgi:hypothetical protein
MATKKIDVPDIGNLLGKISEKRDSGELTKSPIQSVQPIADAVDMKESKNSKTPKQQKYSDVKPQADAGRAPGGRPSAKLDDVEYVKISPRIPKPLKRRVDIAIVEERFRDRNGNQIKTLDELVAFALDRLVG